MLIMIIFFLFVDIGHVCFFTYECILTIFKKVIFVDIYVNSFKSCGSALEYV